MTDIIFWFVVCAGCGLLFHLFATRHRWVYHNPFERRCRACNKHEVMVYTNIAWWETWRDSDPGHPCSEASHD